MQRLVSLFLRIGALCLAVKSFPVHLKSSENSLSDEQSKLCTLCQDTARLVQDVLNSNGTLEDGIALVMPVCLLVMVKERGEFVCPGILKSYGPVVQYVITHGIVRPQDLCAVLHLCPKYDTISSQFNEIMKKNKKKKKYVAEQSYQKETQKSPDRHIKRSRENTLKILQFNDLHLDLLYEEGSATDCGLFMCCRSTLPGKGMAGYYGDYNCDIPLATFDLLLENIKRIDPDIIIYAGDNSPHDVWNETVDGQLAATRYIVNRTSSFLPGKSVYPVLGNHETYPQSEYMGTRPVYQEMTKQIAQYWKQWVNFTQEALETIMTGGYYSVSIMEGLRLVSLNSDVWYGINFYSFMNEENPQYFEQIRWLEETLSMAKRNDEKVLLLAHIPSGTADSLPSYGEVILDVTRRYKSIIVGILSAHTHTDEFELIQDNDGVHGVFLISPSVTTFNHINPSFRVYYMDRTTYQLLDYEQYYLDLNKANEMRRQDLEADFELEYVATEEYSIPDISPTSWDSLVDSFEQHSDLIQQYYYNSHSRSMPFGSCDSECQRDVLCQVNNCNSLDLYLCYL